LSLLLLGAAAVLAMMAGRLPPQSPDRPGWLLGAVVIALVAFCFGTLTVRDVGEKLVVRFGPIPLFGKSIRYADLRHVEAARSTFWDGWGIHYCPGRGWIWNLWGFDCVRIQLQKRTIRIGTDDVAGLVEFLKTKLPG
jgi:hypothetical protein